MKHNDVCPFQREFIGYRFECEYEMIKNNEFQHLEDSERKICLTGRLPPMFLEKIKI